MYTAIYNNKEIRSLDVYEGEFKKTKNFQIEREYKSLASNGLIKCTCCGKPVDFRSGEIYIAHFAHKKGVSDCVYSNYQISKQHIENIFAIGDFIRSKHDEYEIKYNYRLSFGRFANIMIFHENKSLAIEFTSSFVNWNDWEQKNSDYKDNNQPVLWIFSDIFDLFSCEMHRFFERDVVECTNLPFIKFDKNNRCFTFQDAIDIHYDGKLQETKKLQQVYTYDQLELDIVNGFNFDSFFSKRTKVHTQGVNEAKERKEAYELKKAKNLEIKNKRKMKVRELELKWEAERKRVESELREKEEEKKKLENEAKLIEDNFSKLEADARLAVEIGASPNLDELETNHGIGLRMIRNLYKLEEKTLAPNYRYIGEKIWYFLYRKSMLQEVEFISQDIDIDTLKILVDEQKQRKKRKLWIISSRILDDVSLREMFKPYIKCLCGDYPEVFNLSCENAILFDSTYYDRAIKNRVIINGRSLKYTKGNQRIDESEGSQYTFVAEKNVFEEMPHHSSNIMKSADYIIDCREKGFIKRRRTRYGKQELENIQFSEGQKNYDNDGLRIRRCILCGEITREFFYRVGEDECFGFCDESKYDSEIKKAANKYLF